MILSPLEILKPTRDPETARATSVTKEEISWSVKFGAIFISHLLTKSALHRLVPYSTESPILLSAQIFLTSHHLLVLLTAPAHQLPEPNSSIVFPDEELLAGHCVL